MTTYGYDRLGSLDKMKCTDCGQLQGRNELVETPNYDGYDAEGEPILIETYFGCWCCKSPNVEEVKTGEEHVYVGGTLGSPTTI